MRRKSERKMNEIRTKKEPKRRRGGGGGRRDSFTVLLISFSLAALTVAMEERGERETVSTVSGNTYCWTPHTYPPTQQNRARAVCVGFFSDVAGDRIFFTSKHPHTHTPFPCHFHLLMEMKYFQIKLKHTIVELSWIKTARRANALVIERINDAYFVQFSFNFFSWLPHGNLWIYCCECEEEDSSGSTITPSFKQQ